MANATLSANFQMNNDASLDVKDPLTRSSQSSTGFTISDSSGLSATLTGSNFGYAASGDWIGGNRHGGGVESRGPDPLLHLRRLGAGGGNRLRHRLRR